VSGPPHSSPKGAAARGTRLAWLDVLSGLAGLTFAAGLAYRHVRWPRALTWLGLISYSLYLLHPLVIEIYHHFTWTRHPHPFALQVLLATGLLVIIFAVSSLMYLSVERPMQNVGRRVGRWLDARFGLDRFPDPVPARQPAMAGRGYPATD
jgi:peptidoglycan/LPS O-acetylase OafA/YrhL